MIVPARRNRMGTLAIQSNPCGRHYGRFIATSHELVHLYARDISCAVILPRPFTAESSAATTGCAMSTGTTACLAAQTRRVLPRQTERPTLPPPAVL